LSGRQVSLSLGKSELLLQKQSSAILVTNGANGKGHEKGAYS